MIDKIKETLTYLLENGPIDESGGICDNLFRLGNDDHYIALYPHFINLVNLCSETWPNRSTYLGYPINAYPEYSAIDEYEDGAIPKWTDRALELRQSLLRHILTVLEKEPEKCLQIFMTGD